MLKRIVVVNGLPKAGKDEFIKYSSKVLSEEYGEVSVNIGIMTTYKEIASKYFGYREDVKSDRDRNFLNKLKEAADEYSDYTFNYVTNIISSYRYIMDKNVNIFTCMRNPEDIYKLRDYCRKFYPDTKFRGLLINRHTAKEVNNPDDNIKSIMNYDYDYTINNDDSLEELYLLTKGYWGLDIALDSVNNT